MNISRLLLWFAVLLLPLLSQRLRPMLVSFMEDMDMELVWGMLDLAMVLDLAILVLVTMARGLLMPSQRLRLSPRLRPMLDFCTEDMDILVLAMLDLDMLVLAMAMLSQRLMLVCTMEDTDMV